MLGIPMNETQPRPVPQGFPVRFESDDAIVVGDLVCFDTDHATAGERHRMVEKPKTANLSWFAGIVKTIGPMGDDGVRILEVVPPSQTIHGLKINTKKNCSVGDLIGPVDGSYKADTSGVLSILRCTEAVDRSTTSGPVTGVYGLEIELMQISAIVRAL